MLLTDGAGTLIQNGNNYSLNLGTLVQGEQMPVLQFALINAASAPADSLSGSFSTDGVGFGVSGAALPGPIAAGQSYNGLQVTVETGVYGANQETITFNPTDVNASGYSASLPAVTLTIKDSSGAPAVATLNSPTNINFANVRVGTSETQPVSLTNSAIAPAASLDATISASAGAAASGAITGLAPGSTDLTDLSVGLNTSAAGAISGVATLKLTSDAGGNGKAALPLRTIGVSGSVYRPAAASVALATVAVGFPHSPLFQLRIRFPPTATPKT